MVRLGKFILFERTKTLLERFKAGYDKGVGTGKPKRKVFHVGQNSWYSRCKHYDQLWEEQPLFKQSVLALAGLVVSQGVFLKPAVNKQDETYGLAEEAVWRIEKSLVHEHVNMKFYNTVVNIGKYGACFWEIDNTNEFKWQLPTLQECIEPAEADEQGQIVRWRQRVNGVIQAEWTNEELIIIPWNTTTATWPYGSSLGVGSETELEALIDMETNAKDYMEKQAWPYEILALGNENSRVLDSEYATARTEWRNRKPGEGIATRNMPVEIIPGGTGSAPIRELSTLCQLMKDNVHDGLIMPPLSKLYNSTEASAKVMTAHVMSILGQPIQWLLKETYQENVLKRYLEGIGFSRKSCPEVLFESPDVHKKEEGEYWVGLVTAKIQSPKQAAEHLGLEYDEEYWDAEFERQQQELQQNQQVEGKQDVWEVRRKTR